MTVHATPLEKMLEAFPSSIQKSNGWYSHADNPKFDFKDDEEDGHIIIHSWTGRDAETILGMGKVKLKFADLYVRGGAYRPKYREKQLDLLSLSHYLKFPGASSTSLAIAMAIPIEIRKAAEQSA